MKTNKIQLSLSGGGLRAAYFHLGALYELAESGKLQRVAFLTTVSGGSLAAAMFLGEWAEAAARCPGQTVDLTKCVTSAFKRLSKFTRKNPRARAVGSIRALSRLLVYGEAGFNEAMARQYERWLTPALRTMLAPMAEIALPEWRIATSDYCSGKRVMLVFNSRDYPRSSDARYIAGTDLGVARAVSASAGIPGLFEPVRWTDAAQVHYQLADGGILDNHGIRELVDPDMERVCVDASAPLVRASHQNAWTSPLRAMDMLMEQTRTDVVHDGIHFISLRQHMDAPTGLDWKSKIAALRTDLDDFTSIERELAFLAGYQASKGQPLLPDPVPFDYPEGAVALWKLVDNAAMPHQTKDANKLRDEVIQSLDRGRFRVFSRIRLPTLWSVIDWAMQTYLVGTLHMIMLGYVALLIVFLAVVLPARWGQADASIGIASTWVASFVWLAWVHLWRKGDQNRSVLRWLRTLLIAPLLIPCIVIGPPIWIGAASVSNREGSLAGLRKRIGKLMLPQPN